MKCYKAGLVVAIAIFMLATAVFSINAHAAEEIIEYSDVSDMVYQAGGWGTPMPEIAMYATDELEQLKEEILNALLAEEDYLDVRNYNFTRDDWDAIQIFYADILNEHPELFYVRAWTGYSYREDTGKITILFFSYVGSTSEERQLFIEKVEQAVEGIAQDMTDVEKALVLHDYLAQNCAYAYSEYLAGTLGECKNVYNAYGALVEGKAVCNGYALAYSALLRAVGITNDMCISRAMNHAWNVALIDGEWYHVDVTWDDPVWNCEGLVTHSYFLLSDAEMKNRQHYDWSSIVECTSTKYDTYDNLWNGVASQIVLGEKQYYIKCDYEGFRLIERTEEATTSKYENNTIWEVWDGAGHWNSSAYLSKQGDYFYFNDKLNLYAMKPEDDAPQIIYTYEGGDGYIYGAMVYEDGTARLNVDTTPIRESDSYITVDLKAKAPVAPIDYETETVSTTEAMEYSVDSGATWHRCTTNMNMTDFGWNGIKSVEVSFRTAGTNGRFASEAIALTLEALPGVLSGTIKGFGTANASTTLQLLDGNGVVVAETSVTGNNTAYVLEDVLQGTYTMQVLKENHVMRKYTLTVGESVTTQDVELYLVGDVNGDGTLNARDKKIIYNHIAFVASLEDYNLTVADVNGDGSVNARDKKILYNHIAGVSLLW